MYMYFTTGTRDFLEKLQEKHATKGMILLHGGGKSHLVHETDGKSIFQTPRRYEVISSVGALAEEGYFVCNNVPVTDEGKPVFEHQFSAAGDRVASQKGFVAFRLLRPLDSDTYIVMTEWENVSDYERWKNSQAFKDSHQSADMKEYSNSTTRIFSGASYVTTYIAKTDDNE
jgi:heme oxygenase (mycobilin-producing)